MADAPGAMLVAEIGALFTRVTLVDDVDGESRIVGHAQASTTSEAPYQNVLYGVLEAIAQISEMTGRQLVRDGQLIMPQQSGGDGVNHMVAVTSAAGPMMLVITAIAEAFSGRSAMRASRATYTAVLQLVTLDDAVSQAARAPTDPSWIEQQVEALLHLRPDAVLIAGGLEHGAVEAVNRLAHIVGLTALRTRVDGQGQQLQTEARPVIYAGNSAAREQVIAALADRAEITVVDNLRPDLDRECLDPTRQELIRLYAKQILPRLPGWSTLRQMSAMPPRTVCDAEGLLTRFLAERTKRRVLSLDIGAGTSVMMYAAPGRFHPTVLGTVGTVYGLTELLAQRGVERIARWLPFAIEPRALTERLLNRALRPQALPASREDLYLEHALIREALNLAREALVDEIKSEDYDWVLASGGGLIHAPEPGLALLTILDGLEPHGAHDHPIIDIHLDVLGLLPASGALAWFRPDAAVSVIDHDLLRNMPLASVMVLLGEGEPGTQAAEVTLTTVGGATETLVVRHGTIGRLPLPLGHYGHVTVRPSPTVRVGLAAPGEVVSSEGGDIAGSMLGLVIDARGRPLRLPEDSLHRRARLWEWLVALGAEQGPCPYLGEDASVALNQAKPAINGVAASPLPTADSAEARLAGSREARGRGAGRRINLDALRDKSSPPPSSAGDDLDALRQKLEKPKKRGWFGRGKR